jgi:hypothetical protein
VSWTAPHLSIPSNNNINAMAWSTASSILCGSTSEVLNTLEPSRLVTIDPSTGHIVVIGNLPNNTDAIAFTSDFATWQKAKFTASELLDSNVSGANAIYGLGGLRNLVKYAPGIEPKQNITTGLPTNTVSGSDWVFTYTRSSRITDVSYAVEVSTDLVKLDHNGRNHEFVPSGQLFRHVAWEIPVEQCDQRVLPAQAHPGDAVMVAASNLPKQPITVFPAHDHFFRQNRRSSLLTRHRGITFVEQFECRLQLNPNPLKVR